MEFFYLVAEYDRTDRKTCNKIITFQIQVKNEILTETTILQKWMG